MTDATTMNSEEAQAHTTDETTSCAGRQLWLAGLGVAAMIGKGIKQGGRAFDALVEQGQQFEPNLNNGLHRVREEVDGITGKVKSAVNQAGTGFDEKVRASLQRMGIPSIEEVRNLRERVEELARKMEAARQASQEPAAGPAAGEPTVG